MKSIGPWSVYSLNNVRAQYKWLQISMFSDSVSPLSRFYVGLSSILIEICILLNLSFNWLGLKQRNFNIFFHISMIIHFRCRILWAHLFKAFYFIHPIFHMQRGNSHHLIMFSITWDLLWWFPIFAAWSFTINDQIYWLLISYNVIWPSSLHCCFSYQDTEGHIDLYN